MFKGFDFDKSSGDIVALDTNGQPKIWSLNKTNVPSSEEPIVASPHGMTSYKDPNTGMYISILIRISSMTLRSHIPVVFLEYSLHAL